MRKTQKENIQPFLNECEAAINIIAENKIRIRFTREKGKLNATAHAKTNHIELVGDWGDLLSEDVKTAQKAKTTLYYVIGHELGHMDHEPSIIYPSNLMMKVVRVLLALVRKDLRSHIREIRADYCGIIFATHFLHDAKSENRNRIIERCFNYEIEKLKRQPVISIFPFWKKRDKGDSLHPSFKKRRDVMLEYDLFDERLIRVLSNEYSCTSEEIEQLCSCAFNGQMFDLRTNEIIKTEVNHG